MIEQMRHQGDERRKNIDSLFNHKLPNAIAIDARLDSARESVKKTTNAMSVAAGSKPAAETLKIKSGEQPVK